MAAVPADFDPNEATNFEEIEQQWSVVTVEHLEVSGTPAFRGDNTSYGMLIMF
jgi:hypothetical protein